MKTNAFCPISQRKIDENVARFNGFLTLLLLISFILSGSELVILILGLDFFLRSSKFYRYSPIAAISRKIVLLLALTPRPINAGPKIFAARIGLLFSVAVLISSFFTLDLAAVITCSVFGLCALLESAFGFCVACEIYPFIYKFLYRSTI